MSYPKLNSETQAEVQKRFGELEAYLKSLDGYDYRLDLSIKTAASDEEEEYGYDVWGDQVSSNWNASWC